MKPSATGRILLWRGASLWIGLAGEPAGSHAHHAVQIALPFPPGRVRFQISSGDWVSYEAAIVAPDQPHAFDARNQLMATVFVEPESREGRELRRRVGELGICSVEVASIRDEIAALAAAYARKDSDAELIGLTKAAIRKLAGAGSSATRTSEKGSGSSATRASEKGDGSSATRTAEERGDERVSRAIELIRAHLGESVSLGRIAGAVQLSPDRFRHLFLEETGVGLRPYVLWLRLETALAAYVAGSTLTDAAYAGGFADSAHFSRTFKRMFGISPASVRPE